MPTTTPTPASVQTHLYPPSNQNFRDISWSADGSLFAAAGHQGLYVYRYDPLGLQEIMRVEFDFGAGITSLAFHPNDEILVSGHDDGKLTLWNPPDAAPLQSLKAHGRPVSHIEWTSNGQRLLAASDIVEVWEASTWKVAESLELEARNVALSPDGRTVVFDTEMSIDPWTHDFLDEEPAVRLSGCNEFGITAFAFSPDSAWIASNGRSENESQACIWDSSTGQLIAALDVGGDTGRALAFSREGDYLAVGDGSAGLDLWETLSFTRVAHLEMTGPRRGLIQALQFHPDGRTLASMEVGGRVRFWDLDRELARPSPEDEVPESSMHPLNPQRAAMVGGSLRLTNSELPKSGPAWSPTGEWIAYGSGLVDPAVTLINSRCLDEPPISQAQLVALCEVSALQVASSQRVGTPLWAPDGARMLLPSLDDIYLGSVEGGGLSILPKVDASGFSAEAHPVWSPDGTQVAYVSVNNSQEQTDADIYIVDMSSRAVTPFTRASGEEDYPSWSVSGEIAFASDRYGSLDVLVGSSDGGPPERPFQSEFRDETLPAWSPDGRSLALLSFPYGQREHGEVWLLETTSGRLTRLAGLESAWEPLSWSPDGERLAFVSMADGNQDIYFVQVDDKALVRLTDSGADDDAPTWSPDGDLIAYRCERDGRSEICVTSVVEAVDLTAAFPSFETAYVGPLPSGFDFSLTWADGGRLAYVTHPVPSGPSQNWEIFTARLDGSEVTRITDHPATDWSPSFSPDGKQIVFDSNRQGELAPADSGVAGKLYIVSAQGGSPRRLTQADAGLAAWSPNGDWIAFVMFEPPVWDLYVIRPDGSGLQKITDSSMNVSDPTWAPDGRRIAFAGSADGNSGIYEASLDSPGEVELLVDNQFSDGDPHWAPDGQWIAFRSSAWQGHPDLFLVSADGATLFRLTEDPQDETLVGWSVDGSEVMYVSGRDGDRGLFSIDVNQALGSSRD